MSKTYRGSEPSPEHKAWIKKNVDVTYGFCGIITEEMQAAFPQLRRARGYYYDSLWGQRKHWWLVTPEGKVVDPTVSQFPGGPGGVYEELEDGDPIPSGVCPNCGHDVYDGAEFCNDKCSYEYVAYLNHAMC